MSNVTALNHVWKFSIESCCFYNCQVTKQLDINLLWTKYLYVGEKTLNWNKLYSVPRVSMTRKLTFRKVCFGKECPGSAVICSLRSVAEHLEWFLSVALDECNDGTLNYAKNSHTLQCGKYGNCSLHENKVDATKYTKH